MRTLRLSLVGMVTFGLVAGLVVGSAPLLASQGAIIVAQDGSGDYTTITEAVEAAEDGHTILVQPGTYTEAIVISDDLKLTGDGGDPSLVVIQAPPDGPTFSTNVPLWTTTGALAQAGPMSYSMLLVDSDAVVSGLTIQGTGSGVIIHGGAPRLEGLILDGVGCSFRDEAECIAGVDGIVIEAGSRATLDGNTLLSGGPISIVDASEPLVEGNTLNGGPHIWGFPGDEAVIRDNVISGTFTHGLVFGGPSTVTVEGNTITDTPGDGMQVGFFGIGKDKMNAIVRNNDISGARVGINVVAEGSLPTIEGNELSGNATGIQIARSDAIVSGNHVHGNRSGITVDRGSPSLEGNTIEDNEIGIAILTPAAKPTLSDNTLCRNETNFRLMRNVDMPTTDGNDICPDAPA